MFSQEIKEKTVANDFRNSRKGKFGRFVNYNWRISYVQNLHIRYHVAIYFRLRRYEEKMITQ